MAQYCMCDYAEDIDQVGNVPINSSLLWNSGNDGNSIILLDLYIRRLCRHRHDSLLIRVAFLTFLGVGRARCDGRSTAS